MSDSNFQPDEDLEQHLQAELRNYAPEASERLWAGIEAQLPAPRRRRPVLIWWLSGLGMALIVGGGIYLLNHKVGKKTQPVAPGSLVTAEKEKNSSQGPSEKTDPAFTSAQLSRRPGVEKTIVGAEILTNEGNVNSTVSDRLPGKDQAALMDISRVPVFLAPQNTGVTSSLVPISPLHTQSIVLPIQAIVREANLEFLGVPFTAFPVKKFRQHPWQLSIGTAPIWIWQSKKMAEASQAGQMAFYEQHQGPANGWQQGVTISYQLAPNWMLSSGINHRAYTQNSAHDATLRLMDGVCLNPNDAGPKEYEFQYSLQSGGSASDVTVQVAQVDAGVSMPEDEPFMLAMHTMGRSTDWLFPLSIRRSFGRGAWRGFVLGGGQVELPSQTSIQVQHYTEACTDLCFSNGRTPMLTLSAQRTTAVSWLFGLGMELQLTPRWGLSVAPTAFGKKGQTGLSLSTGLNFRL